MEGNSLGESIGFFFFLLTELVILFIGISFIVGVLQEYLPATTIRKVLTGRRGRGNIKGATLGALTPFCSCSSIPIMLGLLNAGAPFGATMSFLLASPLINPIIIGLFLTAFGWRVTAIYTAMCFVLAVLLGALWEKLGLSAYVKKVRITGGPGDTEGPKDFRSRMGRAFSGAWTQFRSLMPFIVIGVAVGSVIHGFVPKEWVVYVAGPQNPLAVPVAAAVGVPLYIRVSTMVPISLALLKKGMSLGAVMALVIGGAGASIPEVSLLASIFKLRLVITFVLTIIFIAMLAGFLFNILI